ncbi:hypothetical protein F4680DRAFT_471879 [Xylaria scruposa]|nr:hypothetical protein F4680DRAFT_471879 [Xylaria scruposa]
MEANRLDQLIANCEDTTSYPTRLQWTHVLPYTLQRYEDLLNEEALRIFSKKPEDWKLGFWDIYDRKSELSFSSYNCTSLQLVGHHLWSSVKEDPACRHVFIEANHSLAPLNCSREMLTSLLSFHQVMPQFLDIVLSFGALRGRSVSTAVQHCIFQYENFFPHRTNARISQLGRSGSEIRHCYNLWSVEKSDDGKCPWAIRQAGLYHSFDIDNGKATWIHVKANDILRKRIEETTMSDKYHLLIDDQNPSRPGNGSFAAALATHLTVFEWCNENWRQYLSHLECRLTEILTKLQETPIQQAGEALNQINANNFQRVTQPVSTSSEYTSVATEIDPFSIFNEIKFDDLQRLYILRSKFEEAKMILGMDAGILTNVVAFYQSYVGSDTSNRSLSVSRFAQRANFIIAELRSERERIAMLISLLENGKSLFHAIEKFKNMELNRFSSRRVESLAEEIEQSAR